MRLTTSGAMSRLDLAPLLMLVEPLLDEWANLDVDERGVRNPLTSAVVPALRLVGGVHREAGARYEVTLTDADRGTPMTLGAALRRDDRTQLAFTITNERDHWEVDATLGRALPRQLDLSGRVDLTAAMRDDGTPGCAANLVGGTGTGTATVSLRALEGMGGRLVEAKGRANRFRGDGGIAVRTTATEWQVDGHLRIRARGLGRLVLLIAGGKIRRHVAANTTRFWETAAADVERLRAELAALAADIEREGGAGPFVHRALWDPSFEVRLPGDRR